MARPYLFAGDRRLAVDALKAVIELGDLPTILVVSDRPSATHADELAEVYRAAGGAEVVLGSRLQTPEVLDRLRSMALDVAISVHFPELVREEALELPQRGWLNLHPAYLPFNRGWHTPSWPILEGTPAGVTLHRMVTEVDAGEILARREVAVEPCDTAHELYQRLLDAELSLLLDVWSTIRSPEPWPLIANDTAAGTVHRRRELLAGGVQRFDLDAPTTARAVLDRLRALTTDRWEEAARFEVNGRTYRARIDIQPEEIE